MSRKLKTIAVPADVCDELHIIQIVHRKKYKNIGEIIEENTRDLRKDIRKHLNL